MRVSESGKRVRNGRIRLRMQLPRWLALAVGSQACALALAPWFAGGLYLGPRPVAPDQVLNGLLWTGDFPLMGMFLVGVAVLIGLLACGWNVAMWRLPIGRVALPFALLLLWMGLSALVNGTGWYGLRRLSEWGVAFVLMLVITAIVRRGASTWTLLVALTTTATLLALRACTEYLINRLIGIPNWRVFASFFNPNLLAGYLVMSAPLTMGILLALERWGKSGQTQRAAFSLAPIQGWTALLTVALWLQLSALVLTGSRMGVVAFVGAFGVFLGLALWWMVLTRAFLLRLALVGVLLIGVVWLSLPAAQRLTPQAATQEVYSGSFRFETWKGTLRMVLANPVLGVGLGAFEWRYPRYASVGFTRLAHNSYLELASEAGIPALLLLLALGIGWLTRALQPELPPPAHSACLLYTSPSPRDRRSAQSGRFRPCLFCQLADAGGTPGTGTGAGDRWGLHDTAKCHRAAWGSPGAERWIGHESCQHGAGRAVCQSGTLRDAGGARAPSGGTAQHRPLAGCQ